MNVLSHVDVGVDVDVDVDLDVNGDEDGDDLLSLTNAQTIGIGAK
jgi:hypothetical protein